MVALTLVTGRINLHQGSRKYIESFISGYITGETNFVHCVPAHVWGEKKEKELQNWRGTD